MLSRDQRGDAMEKEMLQARPPRIRPQVFERGDDAGGGERPALGRDPRRRIEADRPLGVGHVEVAHVVDAGARDGVENIERQVAVRIDHGDPFPCQDVAHGEIEQERRFAAAGFADDVKVALALLAREYDAGTGGCSGNGNDIGLHNVAPAPGENPRCLCSPCLPFVRIPSLWEWRGTAARRATCDGV